MKNFFISGLAPDKKARLQEAGVAFCDFVLAGPPAGIVVEDTQFQRALEILCAEVIGEAPTGLDGIFAVNLRFAQLAPSPVFTVTAGQWDGFNQEQFLSTAREILLPVVKKNIVVSVPHGKTASSDCDGTFRVFIWSGVNRRTEGRKCPREIFGISVDDSRRTGCADAGFDPVGIDVIRDGSYAVAEIVGDNLYIFHDIVHMATSEETALFRKILEEAVLLLSQSPAERAELKKRHVAEQRVKARAAYVKECSGRFEKTVTGTRQAITAGEAEVKKLTETLVKRQRELNGSRRKLEQLEVCKSGELEKYAKEFDRLFNVPKVRNVEAGSGVVKVFTDTLFCTDPRTGKRHEIGAFRIEINTAGANGGVSWFNLTRQVDGYNSGMQAPHVFPAGNACFGNTAETFAELIANYEFAAVAMVAIQFVESVNVDDGAGKHVHKWPLAA